MRKFLIVVMVFCVVALVRLWPQSMAADDESPLTPRGAMTQQAVTPHSSEEGQSRSAAGASPDSSGRPSIATRAAPSLQSPSAAPIRLRVATPTEVRVGQAFQALIEVEADAGVRELLFAVRFERSRLALTGWAAGNFAQQGGIPAELAADESSDGNVLVAFRVRPGSWIAGTGTLVALELEATRTGASGITLHDVSAVGSNGAPEEGVAVVRNGTVKIQ